MSIRIIRFFCISLVGVAVVVGALIAVLMYFGVIIPNNPSRDRFAVRGVDVSSYQGEIDWPLLAQQDIQFAYIKATEGSSFVDPKFDVNYENAIKTNLRIGMYHFFSFDSAGVSQADSFIAHVPKTANMLPPAVDVEFYGDKSKHPPDKTTTQKELRDLLDRLESHYGMKPLLYATEKAYKTYLSGDFAAYDIWIRNVYFEPSLNDGRKWTMWQYADRAKLAGYSGREPYIDLNVFSGTKEDFAKYPIK